MVTEGDEADEKVVVVCFLDDLAVEEIEAG